MSQLPLDGFLGKYFLSGNAYLPFRLNGAAFYLPRA